MTHEIKRTQVAANGLSFEVLTCGVGETLCLLLHGFPENAECWREQMPVLAELGCTVWAPNQRGYAGSSQPERVADYGIQHLVQDVAALIDVSGARRTILIGHDWGAAVAWCFASGIAPGTGPRTGSGAASGPTRPLAALVILNVPHPVCFLRSLRRWSQLRKSWYIFFFQIPWLPEWLGSRQGALAIEQSILRSSTRAESFPRALLASFRAQAADRKTLGTMIHWYRAAFRGGMQRQLQRGFLVIEMPTLMIWGEADVALEKFTTEGTEEFVRDLRIVYLPGVSHWVQQDATAAVNAELQAFISGII